MYVVVFLFSFLIFFSLVYYVTTVCLIGSGIIFASLFHLSKKVGLFKKNNLMPQKQKNHLQIAQRYWTKKNE